MNLNDSELQIVAHITHLASIRRAEAKAAIYDGRGEDAASLHDDAEVFDEVIEAIQAGEHRAGSGAW